MYIGVCVCVCIKIITTFIIKKKKKCIPSRLPDLSMTAVAAAAVCVLQPRVSKTSVTSRITVCIHFVRDFFFPLPT